MLAGVAATGGLVAALVFVLLLVIGGRLDLIDDVLVLLIQRIEAKALVQLSNTLAPVKRAPSQVIGRLARSEEIAIAGPVLTSAKQPVP